MSFSRRSFFVKLGTRAAGGWLALVAGGSAAATLLSGCIFEAKYGGPPNPPDDMTDTKVKYGGPPDLLMPVAPAYGGPTDDMTVVEKYGGPPDMYCPHDAGCDMLANK